MTVYPATKADAFDVKQRIQDDSYLFPYHYVPRIDGRGFRQAFHIARGYEYLSYIDFVVELVMKQGFDSLLDVGCGDGRLLSDLSVQTKGTKRLVGIDYSDRAINLARAMNPDAPIQFVKGDITQPVGRDSFDIATLVEVLEHIPPDEISGFLQGVFQQLHSRGSLIITVPSSNRPVLQKHYQHFTRDTLQEALQPHFHIDECYHINSDAFFVRRVLHRILGNSAFLLNHSTLATKIYSFYKRRYFFASESKAARLVAVCRL